MVKTRTLLKQKESLQKPPKWKIKENSGVTEHDPLEWILNENNAGRTILGCLKNNDPEGVMEVIEFYLRAVNKSKFLKKAKVPRATMYHLFKNKNPTLKTLAKLIHASCSEEKQKSHKQKLQKEEPKAYENTGVRSWR